MFTAVVLFAGCFKEVSYRTDYVLKPLVQENSGDCLLYTSDAADEL